MFDRSEYSKRIDLPLFLANCLLSKIISVDLVQVVGMSDGSRDFDSEFEDGTPLETTS